MAASMSNMLPQPVLSVISCSLMPGGKTISVHETPDDLLKQIEERVLHLARSAKQAGAP
jgi:hypothetical protein